jgi:hypothetical protein
MCALHPFAVLTDRMTPVGWGANYFNGHDFLLR